MPLSTIQQNDLKKFLSNIFGNKVNSWPMNDEIFNLTHEMVLKSEKCSSGMDSVPTPMAIGAKPLTYLSKEAINILLKNILNNKKQHMTCIKGVGIKWKSKFYEASMGV